MVDGTKKSVSRANVLNWADIFTKGCKDLKKVANMRGKVKIFDKKNGARTEN